MGISPLTRDSAIANATFGSPSNLKCALFVFIFPFFKAIIIHSASTSSPVSIGQTLLSSNGFMSCVYNFPAASRNMIIPVMMSSTQRMG